MHPTHLPQWPQPQPCLESERLVLRPFTLNDTRDIEQLAGNFAIADTTLLIPHPYPEGAAAEFLSKCIPKYKEESLCLFAITLKSTPTLIGSISLHAATPYRRAEVGYWIGKPYWNQGFATEALQTLVHFGFNVLKLNKITSSYFARNPASGRVQEKTGFKQEGLLRHHVIRWNRFEDLIVTAIFPQP